MDTPNTAIEYERTFLARELPTAIHSALPTRMVDIYVPDGPDIHPELRLRKRGSGYEITKKTIVSGSDSSEMLEQTVPLSQAEFESLASGHHRLIEKDRYQVTIDGHQAEIDVFSGSLEGLIIIDFEFSGNTDKAAFTPPVCCLVEVTQDIGFAGGSLAGKNYDDLLPLLTKYGYQRLSLV